MKRTLPALLAALALIAAGCGERSQDEVELRRFLGLTKRLSRAFVYREVSKERTFTVRGEVEDDFRYRMVLATESGDLLEQIVNDDALAVRLIRPPNPEEAPIELGHPTVDAALRAGRWVMSPSGAPPLQRPEEEETGEIKDPFRAALEEVRYIETAMSQASRIKEFNLEDLDYKPSEDPWEYPDDDRGQVRYDLIRPDLPKREEQLGGAAGAQGDVGAGHFRKLSAFIEGGRIYQICEVVDVREHEDIRRAKERRNQFLIKLLARILAGRTETPIRERETFVTYEYRDSVKIDLPADAVVGNLDTFKTAFAQGVEQGVLEPQRTQNIRNCDRVEKRK